MFSVSNSEATGTKSLYNSPGKVKQASKTDTAFKFVSFESNKNASNSMREINGERQKIKIKEKLESWQIDNVYEVLESEEREKMQRARMKVKFNSIQEEANGQKSENVSQSD